MPPMPSDILPMRRRERSRVSRKDPCPFLEPRTASLAVAIERVRAKERKATAFMLVSSISGERLKKKISLLVAYDEFVMSQRRSHEMVYEYNLLACCFVARSYMQIGV
jgi:hypothetical protein